MTFTISRSLALVSFALLSTAASAENHVAQDAAGGVTYGNEDCNNDPSYLTANDISCMAVFSNTSVWDFLENLPRRISLATLIELNPSLDIEDHDTVLTGISFVRVR